MSYLANTSKPTIAHSDAKSRIALPLDFIALRMSRVICRAVIRTLGKTWESTAPFGIASMLQGDFRGKTTAIDIWRSNTEAMTSTNKSWWSAWYGYTEWIWKDDEYGRWEHTICVLSTIQYESTYTGRVGRRAVTLRCSNKSFRFLSVYLRGYSISLGVCFPGRRGYFLDKIIHGVRGTYNKPSFAVFNDRHN